MSKRYAFLYTALILLSLLALVATSVAASPPVSPPAPQSSSVLDGGVEWSHFCAASNQFSVYVVSENVLRYTCTNVVKVWSETCDKKAALGFAIEQNGSRSGGVFAQCGI